MSYVIIHLHIRLIVQKYLRGGMFVIELGFSKRDIVVPICKDSTEVLIRAAVEGSMGRVWVAKLGDPKFCLLKTGNHAYTVGLIPKGERALNLRATIIKECDHAYITPTTEAWAIWLEDNLDCNYRKISRYAFKREEQHFDRDILCSFADKIPEGMRMKRIDKHSYRQALREEWSYDFVANFGTEEKFLEYGMGYVIYKGSELVSGCSAYGFAKGMMEITVSTKKEYRRRGLALAAASKFILDCMDKGLYPNWDAASLVSVSLAQKLGYVFDKEYKVFQIDIGGLDD